MLDGIRSGRKVPEPSLLRTHPQTEDCIERLNSMAKELKQDCRQANFLPEHQSAAINSKVPHWHFSGL